MITDIEKCHVSTCDYVGDDTWIVKVPIGNSGFRVPVPMCKSHFDQWRLDESLILHAQAYLFYGFDIGQWGEML